MKRSTERKLLTAGYIFGFLLLSLLAYYWFYSYINNGSTIASCKKNHCIPILSLAEFLSISISLLALFWVIDSLNSWKDQDAYYNSREVNFELKEFIYNCETSIIIKLQQLPKDLPLEDTLKEIKSILPASGIGSPISNLCHKISYENIYHRQELIEISKLVERSINSMWRLVESEKIDFKNIADRINVVSRDDLVCACELNNKVRDELCRLIN